MPADAFLLSGSSFPWFVSARTILLNKSLFNKSVLPRTPSVSHDISCATTQKRVFFPYLMLVLLCEQDLIMDEGLSGFCDAGLCGQEQG